MPSALSIRLDERARAKGIDVVQGVGDLYWVWQKLVRHVDVMNFNILTTSDAQLQTRAIDFMRLLPKVGRISTKRVSQNEYDNVCRLRVPVGGIVELRCSQYSVNNYLENGIRLEAIDPAYEVEWTPGFRITAPPAIRSNILYVSGSKPDHSDVWTPKQWAYLYSRLSDEPVILLGAPYDEWVLLQVATELDKLKIKSRVQTNYSPEDTIRHIRDAKLFVGYQSGLNIIADAYDVPQVMVYFPHLRPMLNTWCKPGHAGKLFKAFTFDQSPEEVANEC